MREFETRNPGPSLQYMYRYILSAFFQSLFHFSCYLSRIRDPVSREFQFKELNVGKMKELKVVGFNYRSSSMKLSWDYMGAVVDLVRHISSQTLTRLEILFDTTDRNLAVMAKLKKVRMRFFVFAF